MSDERELAGYRRWSPVRAPDSVREFAQGERIDPAAVEKGKRTMQAPDVITRYFAAADRRDTDSIVLLFSDDAIVTDENQTWRGVSGVRAWREGVATVYQYTTEVQSVEPAGAATYIARVRLEGNFPGGIADLRYRFTIDGQRIRRLEIVP